MRVGAAAERFVGHARHRREEDPVANLDLADPQRLRQFSDVIHAQKPSRAFACPFSNQSSRFVQCKITPDQGKIGINLAPAIHRD
jgi:hypothetical protein